MKCIIIYYRFYNEIDNGIVIGGIETYIHSLSKVLLNMSYSVNLIQASSKAFRKEYNGINIIGVPVKHMSIQRQKRELYSESLKNYNEKNDIIIFGADHCTIKNNIRNCVSIQHGISWDLPTRFLSQRSIFQSGILGQVKKWHIKREAIHNFDNCKNRVCVDYNFINWYRTMRDNNDNYRTWIIPNYADTVGESKLSETPIRIIFARRFTEYRGSILMAEVAKRIQEEISGIEFTFCGEGPEEINMRKILVNVRGIKFSSFKAEDAVKIHLQYHIAVIPSIASEGTSFAVAEAMAGGCAILATNVGGITNMIISGFNGHLIDPNLLDLYVGLKLLIMNKEYRDKIAQNGLNVSRNAFSYKEWSKRWEMVIASVSGRNL